MPLYESERVAQDRSRAPQVASQLPVARDSEEALAEDQEGPSIAKDLQAGTTWITVRARLPAKTFIDDPGLLSRWRTQIGLRYFFQ